MKIGPPAELISPKLWMLDLYVLTAESSSNCIVAHGLTFISVYSVKW